jgi:hypothetical protein
LPGETRQQRRGSFGQGLQLPPVQIPAEQEVGAEIHTAFARLEPFFVLSIDCMIVAAEIIVMMKTNNKIERRTIPSPTIFNNYDCNFEIVCPMFDLFM